jgi:hypothetical protein
MMQKERAGRLIMRAHRWLALLCSLVVLVGANLHPAYAAGQQAPAVTQPQAPLAPPTQDQFGYRVSPGVFGEYSVAEDIFWVEEAFGTSRDVTFPGGLDNDAISDPVTIGVAQGVPGLASACTPAPPPCPTHSFKFYSNEFDTLYVSMNGVIRFSDTLDSDYLNYPLPTGDLSPAAPSNIIAAFWTDLDINASETTRVFVTFLSNTWPFNGSWNAFAITWENVIRRGVDEPFSFQVVLKDNGDISVNIQSLPASGAGNLSLGIQNELGSDGLLYHYNTYGGDVLAGHYVFFERPSPDWRLRLAPTIQGALTQGGRVSFEVKIKNTSEIAGDVENNDIYDLTVDNPGLWLVEFYDASGKNKFVDTNLNGVPDTGILFLEQEVMVTVKVQAPLGAQPGLDVNLVIRATSFKSGISRTGILQVAVPDAYAQAVSDGIGNSLRLVWHLNQAKTDISNSSGDNFVVVDWQGGYVAAWSEKDLVSGLGYLHYAFFNILGMVTGEGLVLHGVGINDFNPALAVHQATGMAALVWVRDTSTDRQARYAILNASTRTVVVGDHKFSDTIGVDVQSPVVAAHTDSSGDFTAAWVFKPDINNQQIQASLIDVVTGPSVPVNLTDLSEQEIFGLSMEGMAGATHSGKTFLVYCQTQAGGGASIFYQLLAGTTPIQSQISDHVSVDYRITSTAVLSGGQVIVAWLDPTVPTQFGYPVLGVSYRVYSSSLSPLGSVTKLLPPNLLGANFVSVTGDKEGRAVLVWLDNATYRYEYYALINPTASLETGAMMSRILAGPISLSYNGQSLAAYGGRYGVSLPLVRK